MTIFSSNINQLNSKVNLFLEELDTIAWFKNVGKSIHSHKLNNYFLGMMLGHIYKTRIG
ncbi:hypothetical protein CAL7102_08424 [Dulcicalothrix desertica PCC 7102]|nr:hypothetical protein CAL7102_08424 [Dulcicalothrix desertica PCC 7102]